jgi:hypothetical protein
MKYSMSRRMPDTQIRPPAVMAEGNRVDTLEEGIGQQPASQNALRDKPQSRARSNPLLETDLVADRSAHLFAHLPRDPSCRQARRDPAGLEHDDFAADETRMAGGKRVVFPAPSGASMTRLGCAPQGRENLRRIASTGSAGFSTHCIDPNTAFPKPSMLLQMAILPLEL